jgi:hypothetical protein
MAIFQIPLRGDVASYTFNTDLDGDVYKFKMVWNDRQGQWFMSIGDTSSEDYAICGMALACQMDLLSRFRLSTLPPGILTLIDNSGLNEEPDQSGLGSRWILLYEEVV